MAAAVEQSKMTPVNTAIASTAALTFTSTTVSGRAIILLGISTNGTLSSGQVTDNKGNTYTLVKSTLDTLAGVSMGWWIAHNITGGSGHIVTLDTGGSFLCLGGIIEVSGLATSSAFDKGNSNIQQGPGVTSPTSGSTGTLAQADELAVAAIFNVSGLTSSTITPGGGFTLMFDGDDNSANNQIAWSGSYLVAAATTAINESWSTTTGSWTAGIATFKAAGAATAPDQVTGLTVVGKPGRATLSWTAPSDGGSAITDYLIERAPDVSGSPGTYSTVTDGTSTATTYTDTGLTNGSVYWYRVSAINAIGTGTASTAASASPTAHPYIEASAEQHGTSLGASRSITLPSGATTGDLIICYVGVDLAGSASGSPMTASTGWTALTNTSQIQGTTVVHCLAFGRVLDGSGSDSLAVSGPSQDYVAITHRITDHGVTNATINSDITCAGTTGSSTNGNPPNDNPAVSKDWLWLAGIAVDGTTTTAISAVPSNYTQVQNVQSAASTSCVVVATASRRLTASSEDPGTFTHASRAWCTVTMAVPPVANTPITQTAVPGSIALSAPAGTASATGTATQVAVPGSIAITTPAGTASATGSATQVAVPGSVAITAPAGSASGAGSISQVAVPGSVAITAPAGTASPSGAASQVATPGVVAITAPAGTPAASGSTSQTAAPGVIVLSAPAGTPGSGGVLQEAVPGDIVISAPAGTASASGSVAQVAVPGVINVTAPNGSAIAVGTVSQVAVPGVIVLSAPAGSTSSALQVTATPGSLVISAPSGSAVMSGSAAQVATPGTIQMAAPAGTPAGVGTVIRNATPGTIAITAVAGMAIAFIADLYPELLMYEESGLVRFTESPPLRGTDRYFIIFKEAP